MRIGHLFVTFDPFCQKQGPGAGVLVSAVRCEKAAHSLEGGGRACLEGLGHS